MRIKLVIFNIFITTTLFFSIANEVVANPYSDCLENCKKSYTNDVDITKCYDNCTPLGQNPASGSGDEPVNLQSEVKVNSEAKPIKLNIPIGDITEININDTSFGNYLQAWYDFIIGSIGVIATVMMMWGGFKWLTSRGNSGAVTDAKNIIWSALTGVVLAFLSYSILYFINPETTRIGLPTVISHYNEVNIAEMKFHEDEHHDHIPNVTGDTSTPIDPNNVQSTNHRARLEVEGISIHVENENRLDGLTNETIDHVIALNEALPNQNMRLTSGYRPNTSDNHSHHADGDTIDMDDGEDVDPTMEGIIREYQSDHYVDRELGFPIYEFRENPWGITRIVDERTRDASHWHVEF